MYVITQSCLTLCYLLGCNLPGSSVHGILQARILEWVAIPFSRESSWPKDWTQVSHIEGQFFTIWATREACYSVYFSLSIKKSFSMAIKENLCILCSFPLIFSIVAISAIYKIKQTTFHHICACLPVLWIRKRM